jgi:phospholipid/cholesterol/gamma-HCH transport system ATP-binding protein
MGDDLFTVRLNGVTKSFAGRKVLDDVSLEIRAGEGFCLLGRSGAGKTVTLKLMIGLVAPDNGRIFIEHDEIAKLKPAQLAEARKKIGFLFQNAALFDSMTVADNIAFPLRRHTKKSAEEIQKIVHDRLADVELENEGRKMQSELSGGMQKRAGLARALALQPCILLVDEPTSGLDTITAREIYQLLLDAKQKHNVTLVVVTHDAVGARKLADRFAVIENGKLAGSGTFEELARSQDPQVRRLIEGSET